MRINVVTNDEYYALDCLNVAFQGSRHGIRVYLANRPAKGIVEFDFVADDICCIALESIYDALSHIPRWDIRVVIGK